MTVQCTIYHGKNNQQGQIKTTCSSATTYSIHTVECILHYNLTYMQCKLEVIIKAFLQTLAALSWLLWKIVPSRTILFGFRLLDSSLQITYFNTVPKFSECWLTNSLCKQEVNQSYVTKMFLAVKPDVRVKSRSISLKIETTNCYGTVSKSDNSE